MTSTPYTPEPKTMGWSCATRAAYTMDAISAACVEQTGSQNVYVVDGTRYFFEASRREHADGAITGTIQRFINDDQCLKAGTFRIEGDGRVSRGPKFMKSVACYVLDIDGRESAWRGAAPTDDVLRAYIKGEYMKQYEPGGVNRRVAESMGYMPYPNKAHITDTKTGKVVATWRAAMFEAW